jgi:hypothetical protein
VSTFRTNGMYTQEASYAIPASIRTPMAEISAFTNPKSRYWRGITSVRNLASRKFAWGFIFRFQSQFPSLGLNQRPREQELKRVCPHKLPRASPSEGLS